MKLHETATVYPDGSGDEQIRLEGVDSYSLCDADGGDSGCESEEEAQQEEQQEVQQEEAQQEQLEEAQQEQLEEEQQEEQQQEEAEAEPNEPVAKCSKERRRFLLRRTLFLLFLALR
jgi:FtsZ-interacting cell division protein ZipA